MSLPNSVRNPFQLESLSDVQGEIVERLIFARALAAMNGRKDPWPAGGGDSSSPFSTRTDTFPPDKRAHARAGQSRLRAGDRRMWKGEEKQSTS